MADSFFRRGIVGLMASPGPRAPLPSGLQSCAGDLTCHGCSFCCALLPRLSRNIDSMYGPLTTACRRISFATSVRLPMAISG